MTDFLDLQSKMRFTGRLPDIERNRELLDAALAELETYTNIIEALVGANQGSCRHSSHSPTGPSNLLAWCDYCGKCLTVDH